MGCVYFITDGHGHVKIGVGWNPDERIKQLQTGNPFKLKIYNMIHTVGFQEDFTLEKHFHKLFEQCRMEGEWFSFEPVELYLTWLTDVCKNNKKEECKKITCFNGVGYRQNELHYIYAKNRTSKRKEMSLMCEMIDG